jgi:two-component system, NtrC family, sensor histidine kinase HydH
MSSPFQASFHRKSSEAAHSQEKRAQQLSTLWELNKVLLTTMNVDRILHLTLTAVTIGEGFGFNRAMLFLVNEKNHTLQGMTAVGPDSAEEAGKIWSNLAQRQESASELIAGLPTEAEGDSRLTSWVKRVRVPLTLNGCILSRTVTEGKPFNIRLPSVDEHASETPCQRGCQLHSGFGCLVSQELSRDPRVYSFATVPLWGKGKVIGVILVDNLYNQNPITGEDLHFLSLFANQAGLAIENAMLYRNIEEVNKELKETQALLLHREKMAALGELCNTIAHEIRNPLVSIGGFARRLYRSINTDTPEKRYTQTIMIEVARLERILNDILQYSRDGAVALQECDLRAILEESLAVALEGVENGGIQARNQIEEHLPSILGDQPQLKQVFSNLFTNACQAMNDRGVLSIRAYPVSLNGTPHVRIEIQDTGIGMAPENLHNIFNPFYTTKESSLGLGLPIVHKIVTSHGGQIEVDNHPGDGVTFIITLPALQGKDA